MFQCDGGFLSYYNSNQGWVTVTVDVFSNRTRERQDTVTGTRDEIPETLSQNNAIGQIKVNKS